MKLQRGDAMKILVVDDAPYSRDILSKKITNLGHQVFEAENGEQAISMCKSILPDLIFMDIIMPKMDGLTAIKRIMEDVDTKIIVCSSLNYKKMVMEAIFSGAYSYIFKPIDSTQLEQAINSIHPSRREFHPFQKGKAELIPKTEQP